MRIVVFIVFICLADIIIAQPLSLNDCISYAFQNRVELQKQHNAIGTAQKQFEYSKYELLPLVRNDANYAYNARKVFNAETTEWEKQNTENGFVSLYAELMLFNGLSTLNKIKQSKVLLARSKSYHQTIKNNIKLETIQAYYELLMSKENQLITKASMESIKEQVLLIEESVKSGKTSEIDLLEIKAQLAKEFSYSLRADKQYEQSVIKLKKTLNYKRTNDLKVYSVAVATQKFGVNTDSIFLQALALLPEFKLAKQDSIYQNYAIKILNGQYFPVVAFSNNLSTQYLKSPNLTGNNYSFNNQINNNWVNTLGLSVSVPIYSKHLVKKQKIELERQFYDINADNKQLFNDVYFEIEQLCRETNNRQENIKVLEERFDYYQKIYEMRKTQYYHGVLSITELMIAEKNRKDAELQVAYERYNLQFNFKMIEFYKGNI